MIKKIKAVITAIVVLSATLTLTACDSPVAQGDDLVTFQVTELENRGYTDVTYAGTTANGRLKYLVGLGECRAEVYATDMSVFTLEILGSEYEASDVTLLNQSKLIPGCFREE